MKNTIECVSKNKCSGCGACYNKCPKNAISMEYDREGFLFPVVDKNKCVNCGLCQRVCPVDKELSQSGKQKYYAVWASDELRKQSSSGGMFSLLAGYILDLKGIVCGCRYTSDYKYAYHTFAESAEELEPLRKSKYIQSEIRDVYKEIERILNQERWVLFTGTPCQVVGLYSYLDKDYKKLVTADIICHGTPSLKAYEKFLEEKSQGKQIDYVDFRDKSIASWGTVEFIKFKDGTYYYNDCYKGMWYKTFLSGMSTRRCCGSCKYANSVRQGDFTLGDFWGINEILPEKNNEHGVSLVLVNSHKAHNFFKRIVAHERYKEIDKEIVLGLAQKHNGQLLRPTCNHYARARFFEMLDKEGFSKAAKKALYAQYDVGVVGWWYNLNYGGTLTYFALHQVLRKMGFSVLMVARKSDDKNYQPDKLSIPYRFALKHYYISKNHSTYDMPGLNEHCDVFISGSDQLFNPVLWQWSGPEYFLSFVNNTNKKISYASSFGNQYQNISGLTEKMAYWLKRFDAISVREDYGVDIAKEIFDIDAEKVLDPVFLCDKEEYVNLAEQSHCNEAEPYFVNFILDPDEEKRNIIFYAEQKLRKKYINLINADHIQENERKMNMKNTKADADIEEWLYYFLNSDFIITDSFHGTCFAIIFHKPFISIANTARGENRFISLLSEFGLLNHLVYTLDEIENNSKLFEKIDYTVVDKIMEEKKETSLKWLYQAITENKSTNSSSEFRLMDQKIFELESEIQRLRKMIENKSI